MLSCSFFYVSSVIAVTTFEIQRYRADLELTMIIIIFVSMNVTIIVYFSWTHTFNMIFCIFFVKLCANKDDIYTRPPVDRYRTAFLTDSMQANTVPEC